MVVLGGLNRCAYRKFSVREVEDLTEQAFHILDGREISSRKHFAQVQVFTTDVEQTFAGFAISSCSADFLAVRFEAGWNIEVDNVPNIVFVNAHSESDLFWSARRMIRERNQSYRSHDYQVILGHEMILDSHFVRCLHASVERLCFEALFSKF